jgi:hypothetical protein
MNAVGVARPVRASPVVLQSRRDAPLTWATRAQEVMELSKLTSATGLWMRGYDDGVLLCRRTCQSLVIAEARQPYAEKHHSIIHKP